MINLFRELQWIGQAQISHDSRCTLLPFCTIYDAIILPGRIIHAEISIHFIIIFALTSSSEPLVHVLCITGCIRFLFIIYFKCNFRPYLLEPPMAHSDFLVYDYCSSMNTHTHTRFRFTDRAICVPIYSKVVFIGSKQAPKRSRLPLAESHVQAGNPNGAYRN